MTNSGSHNFRNDPMGKMVREVIQNSLDAHVPDIEDPVIVTFSNDVINAEIIGQKFLALHIMSCLDRTKTDENAKRLRSTYERAAEVVSSKEFQCLSIIDANTQGLQSRSWNALIHQEGAVIKSNATPGGTFGVGKNAPFNLSDINTVFYSTRFLTRRGRQEQMEGKSILIPHPDPNPDQVTRHTLQHAGFYRKLDSTPIEGRQIPDYFRLSHNGTGIYIVGFNPDGRDWQTESILAILRNFSYAVHHRQLVVNIKTQTDNPQVTISDTTMEELFTYYTSADDKHRNYYFAIRQKPTYSTKEWKPVGTLNVWVRNNCGPRRTAYLNRNGMLITDIPNDTKRNPLAPRNRAIWPDYTAVIMAADDATDLYIRNMENPSHDEISTEWLETEHERIRTSKAFEGIRRDIADIIEQSVGVTSYGETTNVEEMATYAPEIAPDHGGEVARVLTHRQITLRNRQSPTATVASETDEVIRMVKDDEGNLDIQRQTQRADGEHDRTDAKGENGEENLTGNINKDGVRKGQPNKPVRLQTRFITEDIPDTATIMLTVSGEPDEYVSVKMRILPAGAEADQEEPVRILNVTPVRPSSLKVSTDGVTIEMRALANQRIAIRVQAGQTLNRSTFRVTT